MRLNRNLSVMAAIALAVALAPLSLARVTDKNLSHVRIKNFGCINETLYRGAEPTESDLTDLKALGVKTIVDLQREGNKDEQQLVESLGMKFYRIGMSTTSKPRPEQVAEFLAIIDDPSNQPVFIHCKGGRHRTGAMAAIYRMTHNDWTADRAYAEMKHYEFEKGFGHGALKNYVYSYSSQLEEGEKSRVTSITIQ
jgi:tyrosine-protein phosphatase SIW14